MKEEIYEEEKRESDRVFIYTSCNHIVSVFCFDLDWVYVYSIYGRD